MSELVMIQLNFLLRLLGACICGAVIGYERESQMKMAGVRTHAIVSMTAALMMLISKYGFMDVLGKNVSLDPSRVASGIVTAVGFLGAGVIFTRKVNVTGITTAAGIWATVGIGMAFGSDMYIIGIVTTLCIVFLQFIFHTKFLSSKTAMEELTIQVDSAQDIRTLFQEIFASKKIKISSVNAKRIDACTLELKLYVRFPDAYDIYDMFALLQENPQIKSIII